MLAVWQDKLLQISTGHEDWQQYLLTAEEGAILRGSCIPIATGRQP